MLAARAALLFALAFTLHAGAQTLTDEARLRPALIGLMHRIAQPVDAASFRSPRFEPPPDVVLLPLSFEMYPRQAVRQDRWKTEVAIFHDGVALYVYVLAHDPEPARLSARVGPHDSLTDGGDEIGVFIDPAGNGRRAFLFRVNPAGTTADSIISSTEGNSSYWDGDWDSIAWRTGDGYAVKFRIALSTLEVTDTAKGLHIGLNVQRQIGRDGGTYLSLAPVDVRKPCVQCQYAAATLEGVQAVGQAWLFSPYAATRTTRSGGSNETENRAGLDIQWKPGGGRRFVAAINPDYSQLDIDPAAITINRRFARTLPENRPFFSQDAGLYAVPTDGLVWTRAISDMLLGAQYTQRDKAFTLGVAVARDGLTSVLVPSRESSVLVVRDAPSTNLLARGVFDTDTAFKKGFLVTARAGAGYSNAVVAGDFDYALTERHQLTGQLAASATRDAFAPADAPAAGGGTAGVLRHSFGGDVFSSTTALSYVGNGFRADLGSINQSGIAQFRQTGGLNYTRNPEDLLTGYSLSASADATRAIGGPLIERNASATAGVTLRNVHSLSASLASSMVVYNGVGLASRTASFTYVGRAIDKLLVVYSASVGTSPDFASLETRNAATQSVGLTSALLDWMDASVQWDTERLKGAGGVGYSASAATLDLAFSPKPQHRVALRWTGSTSNTHDIVAGNPFDALAASKRAQVIYTYKPAKKASFVAGVVRDRSRSGAGAPWQTDATTTFVKFAFEAH